MVSQGMIVQNYYAHSLEQLTKEIGDIRKWLVYNKDNELWTKAYFALEVALDAQRLKLDNTPLDLSWLE